MTEGRDRAAPEPKKPGGVSITAGRFGAKIRSLESSWESVSSKKPMLHVNSEELYLQTAIK